MAPTDVLQISLTIIGSLGGGGAIVFALSGYLGRVWADRGLARQRQEYAQLNIAFTNQLDIATRRLQIELDAIGHLHKLRTQAEFEKMQELWKRIAVLRLAFQRLPSRILFGPNETRSELNKKSSKEFVDFVVNAQQLLNEQTLSIPKHIADAANELLKIAHDEGMEAMYYPDPHDRAMFNHAQSEEFFSRRYENQKKFHDGAEKLEVLMRQHMKGSGSET